MRLSLFPEIKEDVLRHLYDWNKKAETTLRRWMKKLSVEFFREGFEKLVLYWRKCVENCGDYVEK
jgi:hypothetical protein